MFKGCIVFYFENWLFF